MASTKRVLMVAFHYPPDSTSSGMLRTLKMSKYLPQFGWIPSVLTVNEAHYETSDRVLLKQVPAEVEVCRTRAVNTKAAFSIRGKYLRACAVPDRFIGWLPFAVAAGMRMVRERGIDALYSTSPLATSHLIAATLQRLSGLPWIADFRDPWTEPELERNARSLVFRLESWLERQVLERADRLVFTTAGLRDYMLGHVAADLSRKSVVITNGYDEDDFSELPALEPEPSPIVFTHTGLVDDCYRSPMLFLKCVAQLMRNGEVGEGEVRVQFVGGGAYLESREFKSLIASLGLETSVSIIGRVSYAECLRMQMTSHVLLLLQCGEDTRTLIPAKAFEYLRIGRPILSVAPESATSELFARVGGAINIHPADEAGMIAGLRQLIAGARAHRWRSSIEVDALHAFGRKQLAAQLVRELDAVTAGDAVVDAPTIRSVAT